MFLLGLRAPFACGFPNREKNIQGRVWLAGKGVACGEGCGLRVCECASRKSLDVLKVEIRQASFGNGRVNSAKQVWMCAKILLEGKMNQPNSRGIPVYGDKPLATAYQGRYLSNIIVIEII